MRVFFTAEQMAGARAAPALLNLAPLFHWAPRCSTSNLPSPRLSTGIESNWTELAQGAALFSAQPAASYCADIRAASPFVLNFGIVPAQASQHHDGRRVGP
jgi:hypothetical protein